MPELRKVSGKDCVKILCNKFNFQISGRKGSHVRLKHADGRRTTVPMHSGENVGVGLLRKILRDTNISRDEFEKLK